MKVVFAGNYPEGTVEKFRQFLPAEDFDLVPVNDQKQYEELTDADCIVLRIFKAHRNIIENNRELVLIQRWGAGVDSVDIDAATEHGVLVANTPGANAYAVSELAILLMLTLGRNLQAHTRSIASGVWSRTLFLDQTFTLNKKLVGLIGGGNIGRQVARKVQAFGASVQYYDKYRLSGELEKEFEMSYVLLEELLRKSDIVSLHVPLTDETRHILDARKLAMLKPNAFVINTARGGLIDDDALLAAVEEKRIAGAGIDCLEHEPLSPDHPMLRYANIVITPHIGGSTSDLADAMIPMIGDNLLRLAKGEQVQYVVNRQEKPVV